MEATEMDSEALRAIFMRIDNFEGEFDFLHPDYRCTVCFKDIRFNSVTHGIQFLRFAHSVEGKTYTYDEASYSSNTVHNYVAQMDASVTLEDEEENPLWNKNRYQWVELLLRDKYRRNEEIRRRLAKTGERKLVFISEDHFLGSDGRNGQNRIGSITEQIRQDMCEYKDHRMWLFMCQNMTQEDFWVTIDEYKDDEQQHRHRLEGKCCYHIGRIPSCSIRPTNPSISRVHASICMNKRGRICIVNYNDLTGVTVNDKQIEPHSPFVMKSGDRFTIGASKRVYCITIDDRLVARKIEDMENKRWELQRKADLKAKRINNELETYLKGSDEVVVLNINFKTKRSDIYDFFSTCGEVVSVQLPQAGGISDDTTSDNVLAKRGMAFVKFKDKKGAANALERDGMYFNYRKIHVEYKNQHTSDSHNNPIKVRSRSRERSSRRDESRQYRNDRYKH